MGKGYSPEQIVRKLREAEGKLANGSTVPKVARGDPQVLKFAGWSNEISAIVAIALSPASRSRFSVGGSEMLGHLLLKHLFKDSLHAFFTPSLTRASTSSFTPV